NPSKEIYAKKIVAALGYIGLANLDRVGITAFSDSLGAMNSPERGRKVYVSMVRHLLSLRPEGGTDINSCLAEYAATCKRPGIAIILSDLLDPNGVEIGLKALRYGNFDITLIQILDPEELHPTLGGYLMMKELESGDTKRITIDHQLQKMYRKNISSLINHVKEFCRNNGIDYFMSDTGIPFEDFLLDYLTKTTLFK
ncbi:MAG: hypothetical protein JRJ65_03805, partial [Deltaproteobacteria bacterium]|nr:hypothetical protein [Deltaproteobacteria bacterium]